MQAITVIAEVPAARGVFQAAIPQLTAAKGMRGNRLDAEAVSRNAERALAAITWTP